MHNTNFPPNIDPHSFSILAVVAGYACVGCYNANEQNSIGNWLILVGQYILTHAAQQQLIESRIENSNININSKNAKKGGSPYTDNNLGKSNQNQRNEVDFILDALKTIQDELKKDNDWISKWISDGWKNEYCPIQVGFDRVILKLTLESIDYDILQSAIDICKFNEDNWIFTKTTSDQDISLNVCKSSNVKYTYIKVNLGNNDILTITPTGKDRADNCTLILHIAPHKYLGNIYNNCVLDEISFIHGKMTEIEQLTGLCFNRYYLELTEAEINMNFIYDLESMTFTDIVNAIGVYQIMNKKSTNNGFSISTLKKSVVDAMSCSIIGKRKISMYTRYTDVDINIYDKSYEAKHGYNLSLIHI